MESASPMPKRYTPSVEAKVESVYVEPELVHFVKLVALVDAKIRVTGRHSGREYLFDGAGSVVDVDQKDVEWMLEKRQGERQCCGGTGGGNVVFQLAEE